jgi:hypothetical protein
LGFSQNRFLSNRKKLFPFFSKTAGSIRVKNFFISNSAKLGCLFFFFFEIWFQKNLAAFTKFLLAKKRLFDSDFSILLLLTIVDGIFQEKKIGTPIGF